MVLIIVMFIGACAGSTGGGLKVSRIMLAIKAAIREMNYYLHPKSVRKVKMDGRTVEQEQIEGVGVYLIVFTIVFGISVFLVMLSGVDLMTGFSAVLTTINNMGPGFNAVGPSANFAHMSTLSKYVLMFDMLAGRLELFPMLLLLHPGLWREAAERELRKNRRKTGQ
jgi:trk system potassium uptake protein TrkH